jgi:HSP20 family molecular chaperone IbpA
MQFFVKRVDGVFFRATGELKGNDLVLKCELPGVDPKDVDVTFDESANQFVIKPDPQ